MSPTERGLARALIGLVLWLALVPAALAARVEVSLLLGDLDSVTAIEAVRMLRQDPALRDVRVHAYPATDIRSRDLAPLARSRVVLVQTVGNALSQAVEPELRRVRAHGGKVYAVGSSWNETLAGLGLERDPELREYMAAGGPANIAHMVRRALVKAAGLRVAVSPPAPIPDFAAYDARSGVFAASFEEYRSRYARHRPGRPWVGLPFYRSNAVSGQTATVLALTEALEARGLNVLPFYGFPVDAAIERFGFDRDGRPVLAALGALSMKISSNPRTLVPLLERLGAPAVNLIALNSRSLAEWEASPQGLDVLERSWQVSLAEFGGLLAPTVVATKEPFTDPGTGLQGVRETPVPERVARAADRIARWVALRETANRDKRVAVLYYNYPPGKENIGAAYLNVLPHSLWNMLQRLSAEGYATQPMPATPDDLLIAIRDRGGNVGNWAPGTLEALVRRGLQDGTVALLPVAEYRRWLDRDVPAKLREPMIAKWGAPEASTIMVWRDPKGTPYFVFPVHRFGNVILAPQPTRGWEQDTAKLYHDVSLPPHHQYLAFYLWLQRTFDVHAMVHVGTHATHEWHSGKEIGFTAADPGEWFVGAVPQLYPYIVDNIGEGLQAKRRGMATIITHLTPPLDTASLNPELRELAQLISDRAVARDKGGQSADALLQDIDVRARRMGLLRDLGLDAVGDDAAVAAVDDYIREVGEKATPFGLHTLGVTPPEAQIASTARLIVGAGADDDPADTVRRETETAERIRASVPAELDALVAGLAGRYVAASPGNDPIRTPDVLPTGRNFYGFDPARLPSPATWAQGAALARDLAEDMHRRTGAWPKRLVFNLWGVESNRHEGVMESQILALMGVRPRWDDRGRVTGVEAIPRADLGRPRVDVTIVPSGLYRDLFSQVMKLLDEAVTVAREQDDADSPIREHVRATVADLLAQGVPEARARQLAGVRMFSVPSGAYGTNLEKIVPLSNTYGQGAAAEKKISDVYFMRMHHAFGQGLWGESAGDTPGLGVALFRGALRGAQAAVHSRSSNVFAALDGDDFYQYLGGTAMAIRQVNGSTPEVYVTNMANPKQPRNESLERYLGRELRSRYLNPKWIDAMMKEGYAGAKFVNQVVEHLWGWQVTVPEAVDGAKWQEMYETWVADRHQLGIRQKFRDAKNLRAYQTIVDRMLTAVRKGYWKASDDTVAALERVNRETIDEAGVGCYRDTCSSEDIVALAEAQDRAAGAEARAMPAPDNAAIARAAGRSAAVAPPAGRSPARTEGTSQRPVAAQPSAASRNPEREAADPTVEGYAIEERKVTAPALPTGGHWSVPLTTLLILASGFLYRLRRSAT